MNLIFDLYERDDKGEAKVDEFGKGIRRPGIKERCLSGTNLSGVDFRGSNLCDIRMYSQGLILCHANLSKLDLSVFFFRGSNLSGANLNGARLLRANFTDANLSGAKLDRAMAPEATFIAANLISASFIKATLTEASFDNANLTTANFKNANGVDFEEAIIKDTIMPDGTLRSS